MAISPVTFFKVSLSILKKSNVACRIKKKDLSPCQSVRVKGPKEVHGGLPDSIKMERNLARVLCIEHHFDHLTFTLINIREYYAYE